MIIMNSMVYTVEPSNKGHFGDNINSSHRVLCREVVLILCPYLEGFTIGGSTVYVSCGLWHMDNVWCVIMNDVFTVLDPILDYTITRQLSASILAD